VLRRDGSFWHEGVRVTHPRLREAFRAGVRWADAERVFVVQLGRFRGWLDVEDTAFFVDAYDAATGELAISDRSREPLAAETLRADPDGVLRCRLAEGFAARFTRAAQAELLAAVEIAADGVCVRAGQRLARAPGLDSLS
jgi:hypothetical protein